MESKLGSCRMNVRVLCLTCVLFLSVFLNQTHAAPTQKVTLLLASPPNVTIGSLFTAEGLGFFKQEGIELSMETSQGTGDAAALLAAGKADFAETSPDSLMVTVGKGGDELSIFTWMQGELNKLVVLDDSPIKQVSDLKGKVVGIAYLGAANHYVLLRELKLAGVSEDTVKIVPLGLLSGQVEPLLERKVDALMASSMGTLLYLSQARGIKIRLIPMQGKPVPTFVIATTHAILNTERDVAIRVGRAFAKGIVYFVANSSAAVDIIAKVHPEIVTDLGLARFQAQYVAINNLLILEENKKYPIGWHDPEIWSYAQQLYQSLGIIPKGVDAKDCYTNDLLGGMNDFDRLAVEQMAHPAAAQSETRTWDASRWMLALVALALVVLTMAALMVHKRRRRARS
jgi:ABC-type nitrate/sulfonate/bicarbonate transport system substrate-binding protein